MRQTNHMAFNRLCDESASPETMRVRNLLLGLPRTCCPADFEFRLQRRLDELESGVRPVRERHGWGVGWAGLGLGVATALLVAVVLFDFSFSSRDIRVPGAPVTSATNAPKTVSQPAADPLVVSSPQAVSPDANAAAVHEQSPAMAAAKDSNTSKNPPTALPENLFHMVGGNSP
ncbi:MAG: hypothetical protein NT025_10280 [bacterium]|nr:hypothetical protein [bacterium]